MLSSERSFLRCASFTNFYPQSSRLKIFELGDSSFQWTTEHDMVPYFQVVGKYVVFNLIKKNYLQILEITAVSFLLLPKFISSYNVNPCFLSPTYVPFSSFGIDANHRRFCYFIHIPVVAVKKISQMPIVGIAFRYTRMQEGHGRMIGNKR
jgi:hypothetical protein